VGGGGDRSDLKNENKTKMGFCGFLGGSRGRPSPLPKMETKRQRKIRNGRREIKSEGQQMESERLGFLVGGGGGRKERRSGELMGRKGLKRALKGL